MTKMQSFMSRIDPVPFLFLTITPLLAGAGLAWHLSTNGFQWPLWIWMVVFYALTAGSITAGYHRLFAHKSYEARTWTKLLLAFFGAGAFQNSILKWATDHRLHHRFVDTDRDPYSISKGFWFAHIGWMLFKQHHDPLAKSMSRDLRSDPIITFQHRHYLPIAILSGFVLPMMIGWWHGDALGGLIVIGLTRMTLLHHATFFINSWCHFFGRQPYSDAHTAKDSLFMAVMTFGEGYHNFHHSFAMDYRNGIKWYHWDPTKWVIQLFYGLGGAHSLKRTPQAEIYRAEINMDERRIQDRWRDQLDVKFQESMRSIKLRFAQAEARFLEAKKALSDRSKTSPEQLAAWRNQFRYAKKDLRQAIRQWRQLIAQVVRGPAPNR